MFNKILIANRGEIAVRIMRTCREMGVRTVAVYSEPDKAALHVLEADEAIRLGKAEPAQSYLNIERLISAARSTGAEAVHPGYGFLAESPEFAAACEKAGIVFVGPPADVIRDLGSKTEARRIMENAGVKVIPGMLQATEDPQTLVQAAEKIDYPVLVKAAAGGGGKGMRTAFSREGMQEACATARSEAQKAFGDGSLYLEKQLKAPRHVEFQILADKHGQAIHLFERECSIQRRHQKIIEETPSPALTAAQREAMGRAALAAARASGYVNAGTVEFLLDRSGDFYFLEVNTRLQVEHPITEMTIGVDLVKEQLRIACGNPLQLRQADIKPRGHAIECRIYAEDPEADFCPSPGLINFHQTPAGPGIRNDCGVYSGYAVPVEYDPILSKLIVEADCRESARLRMLRALQTYAVVGISTSIPFLIDVLNSPQFTDGETGTDFLDRHFTNWKQSAEEIDLARMAYVVDDINSSAMQPAKVKTKGTPSPWETLGEWRLWR